MHCPVGMGAVMARRRMMTPRDTVTPRDMVVRIGVVTRGRAVIVINARRGRRDERRRKIGRGLRWRGSLLGHRLDRWGLLRIQR